MYVTIGELCVAFACDCEDNHPNYVPGWTNYGSDYDRNPAVLKWSWTQYWENLSEHFSHQKVPVTWLMRVDNGPVHDQMLVLFRDKILELKSNGDEIGIHIHTWSWDSELSKWVQTTNPADETKIVFDSVGMFKRNLGFAPLSVRMGWTAISNEIMRALSENGLLVDASALPGVSSSGKFGGRDNIFDWSRVPTTPYHPSSYDYQSPGDLKILETPISSLASNKPGVFQDLVNRLSGKKALVKLVPIAKRLNLTPHRHLYITPYWSSSVYAKIIERYGRIARENELSFLIGTFHPCDILDPRTGKRNMVFERYISNVIKEILAIKNIEVRFMTLSQIAEEFEAKSSKTLSI
jgi:hypothetical protein